MKDRPHKRYTLTPGVEILFGGARVMPFTLPGSRKVVSDLKPDPMILRVQTKPGTFTYYTSTDAAFTVLTGDDADNAAADFESAEEAKRGPK